MSYRENYEKWLRSPALSPEEKAELESIQGDEKRSRAASSTSCPSAPPACGAPWGWGCTG